MPPEGKATTEAVTEKVEKRPLFMIRRNHFACKKEGSKTPGWYYKAGDFVGEQALAVII